MALTRRALRCEIQLGCILGVLLIPVVTARKVDDTCTLAESAFASVQLQSFRVTDRKSVSAKEVKEPSEQANSDIPNPVAHSNLAMLDMLDASTGEKFKPIIAAWLRKFPKAMHRLFEHPVTLSKPAVAFSLQKADFSMHNPMLVILPMGAVLLAFIMPFALVYYISMRDSSSIEDHLPAELTGSLPVPCAQEPDFTSNKIGMPTKYKVYRQAEDQKIAGDQVLTQSVPEESMPQPLPQQDSPKSIDGESDHSLLDEMPPDLLSNLGAPSDTAAALSEDHLRELHELVVRKCQDQEEEMSKMKQEIRQLKGDLTDM